MLICFVKVTPNVNIELQALNVKVFNISRKSMVIKVGSDDYSNLTVLARTVMK